jgi:preprotein translocase subunit SecF
MQVIRLEKVGPVVGEELRQEAFIALILALAGILAYITVRFQFRFAAVSVAALLHDAVITLGIFSLTGMEISSSFIAAILTIVGYSLNDTIVVLTASGRTGKISGARG